MGVNLRFDYIAHRYRRQRQWALKDIDESVNAGEFVALLGRSGCGKSTLLQIAAGLVQPTEGCVRIQGHMVTKPSARWNLMFQRPCLYPWMNVFDSVALGPAFAGQKRQAKARVQELIDLVGLGELARSNVQNLSGGQQQRVALARSLATDPELLLLDEPFSALDTFTRTALQDDVAAIARQRGLTLMLVTHDIEEAVAMADRVLIMASHPGRIVGQLAIDLPYPRRRSDAAFLALRERLVNEFETLATAA